MYALAVFLPFAILVDEGLALLLVVAILTNLVLISAEVQGRCGDVQVTFLYDAGHETIEKGHDKRVDVRTIDVGVGHDDNLIVAQLVDVGLLIVFAFNAETHANALYDVHYRLGLEHLMPLHLLYIQYLSFQRKYGLRVAVAPLLGRTTCRVALHEEYFRRFGVFVRAVGQLTGQSATRHGVLSLNTLACLAGGDTRCGGQYHLVANKFGLLGMFFQIIAKGLAYGLLNGTRHFAVAQLGFGLAFKLRLGHLDGDNGGKSFAEVFACYFNLRFFYLLGYNRVVVGVGFERTRKGHAETRKVGTAFNGVDVVHIRVYVLAVIGVIHHSHLDGDVLFLRFKVDNVVEEVCAVAVDVTHELFQTIFGMERLRTCLAVFIGAKVGQGYLNAGIEVRQFAHARCNDVPTVHRCGENAGVGPELLARSALIRLADNLYRIKRLTRFVLLLVNFTVAEHLREHSRRQCVYAANAHAMQSAAHLIRAFVELTAGVQHGHHHFQCRFVQLFVFVYGYASPVVLHGYGVIFVNRYFDVATITGHSLVDRVIHSFVNEVVQSLFADVSDVHRGAFAHRFQAFKHLDVTGRVVVLVVLIFYHCLD